MKQWDLDLSNMSEIPRCFFLANPSINMIACLHSFKSHQFSSLTWTWAEVLQTKVYFLKAFARFVNADRKHHRFRENQEIYFISFFFFYDENGSYQFVSSTTPNHSLLKYFWLYVCLWKLLASKPCFVPVLCHLGSNRQRPRFLRRAEREN